MKTHLEKFFRKTAIFSATTINAQNKIAIKKLILRQILLVQQMI
jgi:hypothetical protein